MCGWYMQIPSWECQSESQSVSASLQQSVKSTDREPWLPGEDVLSKEKTLDLEDKTEWLQWASSWVPAGWEAEKVLWGLEDNTAWCGQKKKLAVYQSFTYLQRFNTFQKNKKTYVFITKCYGHSSLWLYNSSRWTLQELEKLITLTKMSFNLSKSLTLKKGKVMDKFCDIIFKILNRNDSQYNLKDMATI